MVVLGGSSGADIYNTGLPYLIVGDNFGLWFEFQGSPDSEYSFMLGNSTNMITLAIRGQNLNLRIDIEENPEFERSYTLPGYDQNTPNRLHFRNLGNQIQLIWNSIPIGSQPDLGVLQPGPLYFGSEVSADHKLVIMDLGFEINTAFPDLIDVVEIPTVPETRTDGLDEFAVNHGILIGSSVGPSSLRTINDYSITLVEEYNILTPENALKWIETHPEEGRYDFCDADAIISFAETNHLQVHGHTLVWEQQMPKWVNQYEGDRDDWIALLRDHIFTVAGRYQGRIEAWDVVNEAFTESGELKKTIWWRKIGPEYIPLSLQWAHEADPTARLFLNDVFNEEVNLKSDGISDLAQDLLAIGIPLDGIGFQMHLSETSPPNPQSIAANFQRFHELGLAVAITELDIRIQAPVTPEKLANQAEIYREIITVCVQAPNCDTFIMWGVSDRNSWIPDFYEDWGSPLLFDEEYLPKPAYYSLLEVLAP